MRIDTKNRIIYYQSNFFGFSPEEIKEYFYLLELVKGKFKEVELNFTEKEEISLDKNNIDIKIPISPTQGPIIKDWPWINPNPPIIPWDGIQYTGVTGNCDAPDSGE